MIAEQMEELIKSALNVSYIHLENESHMHSGGNPESHFKLILVSDDFEGLAKVKRHQKIYVVLGDVMQQIHALGLHLYTQEEWLANDAVVASPRCMGGSKR